MKPHFEESRKERMERVLYYLNHTRRIFLLRLMSIGLGLLPLIIVCTFADWKISGQLHIYAVAHALRAVLDYTYCEVAPTVCVIQVVCLLALLFMTLVSIILSNIIITHLWKRE